MQFQVQGKNFRVEVINSVDDYVILMKSIFDFNVIKSLISGSDKRKPFNVLIDSMNGGNFKRYHFDYCSKSEQIQIYFFIFSDWTICETYFCR